MAKSSRPAKTTKDKSTVRNSRTTVSGPAEPDGSGPGDILAEKAAGTQDLASAFPFNPDKAAEYDPDAARAARGTRHGNVRGCAVKFCTDEGNWDQYRHCKPILAVGASDQLLTACGIDPALPDGQPDPGVITTADTRAVTDGFIAAIARHRHFARETDPPRVRGTARRSHQHEERRHG